MLWTTKQNESSSMDSKCCWTKNADAWKLNGTEFDVLPLLIVKDVPGLDNDKMTIKSRLLLTAILSLKVYPKPIIASDSTSMLLKTVPQFGQFSVYAMN